MTDHIHVLYIDNDPIILDIATEFLELTGEYTVIPVYNAADAIRIHSENPFDAIVSEYEMEKMNGIELLKYLRTKGDTTPFIIFTGKGREEVVIEAFNSGADFYLQKGGQPSAQFAELSNKIQYAVSRRRAERELIESHKKTTDIIEFLPDATFAINTEGVVIAWNRAMEEMTGISKEEMIGQGDHTYMIPFYGKRRHSLLYLIDSDEEDLISEYEFVHRQGNTLYAEVFAPGLFGGKGAHIWITGAPLFDVHGDRIGAIESIRDITHRKLTENELLRKNEELNAAYEEIAATEEELRVHLEEVTRQGSILRIHENRLLMAQEIGQIGCWEYNLETNTIWGSAEAQRIYGFAPIAGDIPLDEVENCVQDSGSVHQAFIDFLSGKRDYDLEISINPADGSAPRVIRSVARLEKDTHGSPIRVVGIIQEVTELKHAEDDRERLIIDLGANNEELQAAYEELSATEEELRHQYDTISKAEADLRQSTEYLENLISIANVPIIVWNPSFQITRLNHAFELLIGRPGKDVIGNPLEFLFPPDQADRSMRLFRTTLDGVRWETVEIDILHRDGSLRTLLWNSATLFSPDGVTPVATIAQGHDITEERRLEQAKDVALIQIQKNLAQLAILNDEIRNPLTIITLSTERIHDSQVSDQIIEQAVRIDEMVNQLDRRWTESEKVLNVIRKHHQIQTVQPELKVSEETTPAAGGKKEILIEEVQAQLYTILDSIDAFVFVADLETYEILYLNRLGRSLFGDIAGKTCYQIIQKDQSGPCPFCTNHLLIDEFGPTGVHQKETHNTRNGRWYDCRDRVIRWSDGRLVHLQIATDITERKSIEDALRENEYTFRKLYEESSDPILLMQNDRFIECNQAALDLLGVSTKEEFIGSTPMDISPEVQPDGRLSAEAAPEYIAQAHTEGKGRFEWMIQRIDGTPILLGVSLFPIIFKGEEMLHITWRDNTERKELEQSIRESEEQLRAILDATPFPVAIVDIQDNQINYWSRSAITIFGHVTPTAPEWYQIAYPDPVYRQEVIDRWKPFLEMAKLSSQPVNTGEYQVTCRDGSLRFCELYATFLTDTLIVTFNDVTERKQGEKLLKQTNDELQSLTEELEEREEELAKQIQEIVRTKNEWEGIFQAIGNPTLILDAHHRIRDANNAILVLSGKTLDQLRTMHCWELFHGPSETQPHKCCPFEKMKVTGKLETAEMEVEAFGEVYLVSCTPLFNADGSLNRVIHIATNITERKQVEEALFSAQERLKEAHQLAHIGTWDWTIKDDIVTWSEELYTITGTDPALPALTYAEMSGIHTPSSWERLSNAVTRAMTTSEPYNLELELIRPDGTRRWVLACGGVTRNRKGAIIGLHGILQDISDRKLAVESLRESEAILQDIIEKNPLSIQIVDKDGFTRKVNRAHTLLFGSIPPSDFSIFADLTNKHPALEKLILLVKSGEVVHLPDLYFNVHDSYPEYPDVPVWVRAIIFPLFDKDGKPEQFVLMHENITERKLAEELLRESEKKYHSIFKNSPFGIFHSNFEGKFIDVNPALARMLGYNSPDEAVLSITNIGEQIYVKPPLRDKIATTALGAGGIISVENLYRRRDGTQWYGMLHLRIIPEQPGRPSYYEGFVEDITERKQAEEALHESNKKLRLLTGVTRHDIYNQLSAVQLLQELALQTSDHAKNREYISQSQIAVTQIDRTIGFTREYEDFGITSSGWQRIYQIVESAKREVSPDSVTIEDLIPQDLEVYADPIIRKVFTTLIENAIRHGGKIRNIRFFCSDREDMVIISCEDDGIGIPSEEKGYIFDHGYGKHTGIGLFLAREILSITGLSIRECGVPGGGARFEILVPAGKYRIHPEETP